MRDLDIGAVVHAVQRRQVPKTKVGANVIARLATA
jgi:hypothetical protein